MPKETLIAGLQGSNSLVKQKLTEDKLKNWKEEIEGLVLAFLDGSAEVDPIDPNKTCKHCDLKPLCRIAESAEDEGEQEPSKEEEDE